MSGHSKWAKIKHKKGANDAKKGKIFSKFSQQISIAARDGGGDLDTNFTLRLLVDKAKAASMPADNIQRAIDRGTGKGGDALVVKSETYEGQGPAGISVIVETLTDNHNRTIADLRKAFSAKGGVLGETGSVVWNFDRLGLVTMQVAKKKKSEKFGGKDEIIGQDLEGAMLDIMEIDGIKEIIDYVESESDDKDLNGEYFDIHTDPKHLALVRDSIDSKGYIVRSAELIWQSKAQKDIDDAGLDKVESFIEEIDEIEEVQTIWTDVDDKLN